MKTTSFCVLLTGLALTFIPVAQAEQGSKARAALKARIHQAVEDEDWVAVTNLQAALAKLDTSLGKTPPPSPQTVPIAETEHVDLFSKLTDAGFSLQLAPDDDNPAKFAFTDNIEADKQTYTADFFLAWKLPNSIAAPLGLRETAWDLNASASVQGKISSADNSKTDAWRFRATVNGRYTWNPRSLNPDTEAAVLWNASLKDEGSRGFEYNRLGGEFNLTAIAPGIAMGTDKPAKTTDAAGKVIDPPVQFRWQPFLGVDAGAITSTTSAFPKGAEDTLWLMARCTAKLKLNALAHALNFDEVSLFADDKVIYLSEEKTSHNYLKAGLNLMITTNVGFSLDYTVGESSPKFAREEIFAGAITVRFK